MIIKQDRILISPTRRKIGPPLGVGQLLAEAPYIDTFESLEIS